MARCFYDDLVNGVVHAVDLLNLFGRPNDGSATDSVKPYWFDVRKENLIDPATGNAVDAVPHTPCAMIIPDGEVDYDSGDNRCYMMGFRVGVLLVDHNFATADGVTIDQDANATGLGAHARLNLTKRLGWDQRVRRLFKHHNNLELMRTHIETAANIPTGSMVECLENIIVRQYTIPDVLKIMEQGLWRSWRVMEFVVSEPGTDAGEAIT